MVIPYGTLNLQTMQYLNVLVPTVTARVKHGASFQRICSTDRKIIRELSHSAAHVFL